MSTATAPETVDVVSGEVLDTRGPIPPSMLSQASRAEIDIQITTAKRFPRSIKRFKQEAMELATLDEETAASCIYALPRGGKPISGPSIRLAEIVAGAWGNFRADARITNDDGKFITAEAVAWDLEKNTAIRMEVRRRITDKNGRRYNDDMIGVTGNAARSIALRNAVFAVVPRAIFKDVYEAAKKVAIGDASTISARRASLVEYFGKMGVTVDRLLAKVEKAGVEDIGLDDLEVLRGLANAIKDGDATVDETFPDPKAAPAPGPKTAGDIADEVGKQMDAAINKGKPADAPASPEVASRREKIIEQGKAASTKDAKPAAEIKCSPGKAGCADDGGNKKGPDGKTRYYCSKHDPDNKPTS